jgi:hypothetical protein
MRGKDERQLDIFSYISPEQRVPQDHLLRFSSTLERRKDVGLADGLLLPSFTTRRG